MILGFSMLNAQVSDALLSAEANNGENPEIQEITLPNWKKFENVVGKMLPQSTSYPQVYLEVTIGKEKITIIPDFLLEDNGKYIVIDAKASRITDLSKTGTPNLTSKLTPNQKKVYPMIDEQSLTARVKKGRESLDRKGTLGAGIIVLRKGIDFYVTEKPAKYDKAIKRTLK